MSAPPRPLRLHPDHERELARRLDRADAEREPVLVEIAGNRYRLVPDEIRTTDDPAAGYDPDTVLAAIETAAGAFAGIDVAAFLADVIDAREQDSSGRPA